MSKKTNEKTDTPAKATTPRLATEVVAPAFSPKQSLLAAKELAAQLDTFADGDDIEDHLRRVEDTAELMMVDGTVMYQAILLSLDDATRMEFSAWLKAEKLQDEVKGKPDALKKRLLEKFQVRKSLLERLDFVVQPRRKELRLVMDVLERKRVYNEMIEEMMKNREKLMVEATLQLLSPEDRTDYCNLRPDEAKREINHLIEFVRRKEEERLRDQKFSQTKKKEKNQNEEEDEDDDRRLTKRDDERDRLLGEGRCFICKKIGHRAKDCPDNADNAEDDDAHKEQVICYHCGEPGHTRDDCPKKNEKKKATTKKGRGSGASLL